MIILGIETSCDETAICLIETDDNSHACAGGSTPNACPNNDSIGRVKILGNQLYSQIALHAQYGGVYPMMAKREHVKNLTPLLEQCLIESDLLKTNAEKSNTKVSDEKKEKIKQILIREQGLFEPFIELAKKIDLTSWSKKIDVIAVTNGPGLEPALWVGVSFAKAISELWNIPVIPTNHMEGHILVAQLKNLEPRIYNLEPINYPAIALLISGGHTQLVLMLAPKTLQRWN